MQLDLKTGKSTKEVPLAKEYFGEGITILNDTVYQLTWKENKVFVYSAKDFKKIKEFPLNTEGWGITHNGKELIVTDGSANLYFYEPSTFRLLRTQLPIPRRPDLPAGLGGLRCTAPPVSFYP